MKFGTKYKFFCECFNVAWVSHTLLISTSLLLFSDVLFTPVDFFCIHFLKKSNILQNESRGEEAVKHHYPRLRLYVHVHCFSNMWQYRGGLDLLMHIPDWSHITSDKIHQTVSLHLHSKQSSRASIALSSMGVDTQGKPLVSLQPHTFRLCFTFWSLSDAPVPRTCADVRLSTMLWFIDLDRDVPSTDADLVASSVIKSVALRNPWRIIKS